MDNKYTIGCVALLAWCLIEPSLESIGQPLNSITSSGLGTKVSTSPSNPGQLDITGGTRPGNGPNLFHSFGQFGVSANNIANFLNETALPTTNILGRVTGGNPSNIFGTIQTTGFGAANLFLMNPAGIVFGPNASLNVGGSVAFTTADYLRLADGVRFNALPGPQDVALSSAPVAAFGFLGSNPAAITVQGGQLSVPAGHGIALVGGDITIEGAAMGPDHIQPKQLSAPGGQVQIASARSAGEFSAQGLEQRPNVNGHSFGALGTVEIVQHSVVDTSGDGGGTVVIRSGRFIIDDSRISANTRDPAPGQLVHSFGSGIDIQVTQDAIIQNRAVLETNVEGTAPTGARSGGIRVDADSITIRSIFDFETLPFTGIRSNVEQGNRGGGSGDIQLNARSIEMRDLGQIEAVTRGDGKGGNISLHATDSVKIDSGIIGTGSFQSGNAGDIDLVVVRGNVEMINFPTITSQAFEGSTGKAGRLTVTASQGDVMLADLGFLFSNISGTGGTGGSGGVEISANNLTLKGQSVVVGDNFSPLRPGDIKLALTGNLNLEGGSFIQTTSRERATSSDINISTKEMRVTGDSFLSTESFGEGRGGQLNIDAKSLLLTDGSQLRSGTSGTSPTAIGGNINISAAQSVSLNNGSITSSSTGPANAGNIHINAGSQFISQNGKVTTDAAQARGGNITVQATDAIRLTNSQINASVRGGPTSAGGNITLDPAIVTLQNSQVTAEAVGGQGGNINIIAGTFLADQTSRVSASSQFGLSGTVNIQSPVSSLSGTLATLPQRPLQVHNLLSQRCAAQASGQLSSLVVAGRDTLPGEPGGWLMSPLAWMPDEAPIQHTDRIGRDSVEMSLQSQAAKPDGDQLSDSRQLDVAGCGS